MTRWVDRAGLRLPASVYALLGMELVSAVGSGLVLPFTSIYLFRVRDVPAGTIALLVAAMAAAGLVSALVAGSAASRFSPTRIAAGGLVLQGLGFTLIGVLSTAPAIAGAMVLAGLGTGLANPMLGVILTGLTPPDRLPVAFAASHWTLNVGIGVGALVGGVALGSLRASRFTLLFGLNGATFVLLAVGLLILGTRLRAASAPDDGVEGDDVGSSPGYWALLAMPTLVLVLVSQLLTEAAGFVQLDSSVTLLLNRIAYDPGAIGVLVGVNTLAVVVLQIPISAATRNRPRASLLIVQHAVWLVGYGLAIVATMTGGVRGTAGFVLLAVFFALFAVGECLYSSAVMPMTKDAVPPAALARAFSLMSTVSSTSKLAGPAIGVVLAGSARPTSLWALMVAGSVAAIGCLVVVARRLPRDVVSTTPVPSTEVAG